MQHKYVCVLTKHIPPKLLAEVYGVLWEECIVPIPQFFHQYPEQYSQYIPLTYRPNGDYKRHLKKLKLEHLLKSK